MQSAGGVSPQRVRNSAEDGVDGSPRPVVAVPLGCSRGAGLLAVGISNLLHGPDWSGWLVLALGLASLVAFGMLETRRRNWRHEQQSVLLRGRPRLPPSGPFRDRCRWAAGCGTYASSVTARDGDG